MTAVEETRVKIRRRMRGSAVFFLVISTIGGLGLLILASSEQETLSTEDLFGRVLLVFGLFASGLGAWHGSRAAALGCLGLLLFSPVMALFGIETLNIADWVRTLLYAGVAVLMTVSAIRYRTLSKEANLSIGGLSVLRWTGALLSWAVLVFLGFGFSVILLGTSGTVQRGSDLTAQQIDWMVEQNFLIPGERPLFFYLDGTFSIEEGGSLLTDQYAGGWWKENGEVKSVWIELGQICEVRTVRDGSFFEDAVYSIHNPGDESWIELWLSTEGDLDHRFISRMKSINDRKMRPEVQKFCDENRVIDWVEVANGNGISQDIVSGEDLPDAHRDWLTEQEFLLPEETILAFYSYGIFDLEAGGALLTDQFFGGWFQENGELAQWWQGMGEICRIDPPVPNDTKVTFRIHGPNDEWLNLVLPGQGDQAQDLIDQVLTLNAQAATEESQAGCAQDSSGTSSSSSD